VVWNVASIEDQPSVHLYNWTIKETNEGGAYFVGEESGGSGRVSTRIVEFDDEKKVGRTTSGRVYQLCGEERRSSNGEYVWIRYKMINNLTDKVEENEALTVS
jgi:hypothetical protein